jgi:hypothetical protein
MATAAAVATAVAALASTGYGIYSGERQSDMARKAAEAQEAAQAKLVAREEERYEQDRRAQGMAAQADASRRRARLLALQNGGRYGQVLSGTQGTGYTGGAGTILGAY